MSKRGEVTCNDCYFRSAGLCALALERPCPTFRLTKRNGLTPPKQPMLVPRPVPSFGAAAAA